MSQLISRRRFVEVLGATFALSALSAGWSPARAGPATSRTPASPTSSAPLSTRRNFGGPWLSAQEAVAQASSAAVAEVPINVWAATTTNEVSAAVADIPPRVYVPHELGGDVAVIDPASMQVVDRFWVGRTPHHVAPAHDLGRLWVNVMDSNLLVMLDPRVGRPVEAVSVPQPYNLYFSPDGTKAIVAAERFNRLDFYDSSTWAPIARVAIPGSGVDHLDFSADGSYLLVSCEFGGQLVKVDVNQPGVIGVLPAGGLPVDVKLSPDGTVFFVANQGRHGVSIVDPEAMQEVGFLPTGRGAHGFAYSRDTQALFVANRLAGTISVIDVAARSVADSWPVGGSPDMLQVSPDGQQLWASARNHGSVYVIDTNNGQVIHRIATGAAPHGLTYFPQPGRYSLGHNGVYR